MRQKAGPALPLHLPILYRKTNSNPSRYSPFARASALKGFTPARSREVYWHFRKFWGQTRFRPVQAKSTRTCPRPLVAKRVDVGIRRGRVSGIGDNGVERFSEVPI